MDLEQLKEELKDSLHSVRCHAACAIADLGDKGGDAVPELILALADDDLEVKKAVLFALGSIGPLARDALPAIARIRRGPEGRLRWIADRAIDKIRRVALVSGSTTI